MPIVLENATTAADALQWIEENTGTFTLADTADILQSHTITNTNSSPLP